MCSCVHVAGDNVGGGGGGSDGGGNGGGDGGGGGGSDGNFCDMFGGSDEGRNGGDGEWEIRTGAVRLVSIEREGEDTTQSFDLPSS